MSAQGAVEGDTLKILVEGIGCREEGAGELYTRDGDGFLTACDPNIDRALKGFARLAFTRPTTSYRFVGVLLATILRHNPAVAKIVIVGFSYGGLIVSRLVELLYETETPSEIRRLHPHALFPAEFTDADIRDVRAKLRAYTVASVYIPTAEISKAMNMEHIMFERDASLLLRSRASKHRDMVTWLEPPERDVRALSLGRRWRLHFSYGSTLFESLLHGNADLPFAIKERSKRLSGPMEARIERVSRRNNATGKLDRFHRVFDK